MAAADAPERLMSILEGHSPTRADGRLPPAAPPQPPPPPLQLQIQLAAAPASGPPPLAHVPAPHYAHSWQLAQFNPPQPTSHAAPLYRLPQGIAPRPYEPYHLDQAPLDYSHYQAPVQAAHAHYQPLYSVMFAPPPPAAPPSQQQQHGQQQQQQQQPPAAARPPPTLSLDTSQTALAAASSQWVSPPSASAAPPPMSAIEAGPQSASPWTGPPPPLSLSLGASSSSLAARRRNTTDFSALRKMAQEARSPVERARDAEADDSSSGASGGLARSTTSGAGLSAAPSSLLSAGSSAPTSTSSRHGGSHSGASSGTVPTLARIKEPLPSSPEVDAEGSESPHQVKREEYDERSDRDSYGEDELADDGGGEDGDDGGEYRPGATTANSMTTRRRRAGRNAGPEGAVHVNGAARGQRRDIDAVDRRASEGGTTGSNPSGDRPAKRRKSEADAEAGGPPDKKFTCPHPGCGRSFARNFNLQSHIKSHQGIREFKCPECSKLFSRKHDCTRHCISLHNYDKDGVPPPERQPLHVAQKLVTASSGASRPGERLPAGDHSHGDSSRTTSTAPNAGVPASLGAPLFSGQPLATKRDADRSSYTQFAPPHGYYGEQYQGGDDGNDGDGGYADDDGYDCARSASQRTQPSPSQYSFAPQPVPPPSLSFDHPSLQPSAGPDGQQ